MRRLLNITNKLFESGSGGENDLLSPFNQSKMIGDETKIFDYGDVQAYQSTYIHANNRSIRYVKLNDEGEIICVLQFRTKGPRSKKGIIQNVYTRSDSRRKGYALELLKKARWDFDVKHSKDLTTDGNAWKSGIGEASPSFTK